MSTHVIVFDETTGVWDVCERFAEEDWTRHEDDDEDAPDSLAVLLAVAKHADRDEDGELTEKGRAQLRAALEPEAEDFDEGWDESKHPRDHGKFASKPGAKGDDKPSSERKVGEKWESNGVWYTKKANGSVARTSKPSAPKPKADKPAEQTSAAPPPEKFRPVPKPPGTGSKLTDHQAGLPHAVRGQNLGLSKDEQESATWYTDSNYIKLNESLRSGADLTPEQKMRAAHLDAAFAKVPPFEKPVPVLRALTIKGDDLTRFLEGARRAVETGGIVTMPGYGSTTTAPVASFPGNITLRINATHALDMQPFSLSPNEDELLLPNRARFRFTKVDERPDGKYIIHMDQVPPEAREQ